MKRKRNGLPLSFMKAFAGINSTERTNLNLFDIVDADYDEVVMGESTRVQGDSMSKRYEKHCLEYNKKKTPGSKFLEDRREYEEG